MYFILSYNSFQQYSIPSFLDSRFHGLRAPQFQDVICTSAEVFPIIVFFIIYKLKVIS